MAARTTAQWRREVPAYDRAIWAVEGLLVAFPDWPLRRVIAHLHPDTRAVSILLRGPGSHALTAPADEHLARLGYSPGGWTHEDTRGVEVWRKDVTAGE